MVEYVQIGDKEYPIRISYYVMKKIKEVTGHSPEKAMESAADDMSIHEEILFAALQVGAFAEKQELDLKREDMPFALDLCFNEYLKAFSSKKFFPKESLEQADEKAEDLEKEMGNEGKELKRKKETPPPKPKPQT